MIVSNTSPLRYLIGVGHANLAGLLFDQVLIPPAVLAELNHPSSLVEVRQWLRHPPEWLTVQGSREEPHEALVNLLDRGESEAIQLALEMDAPLS